MNAGAARIDITPEMGIQLAGDIGRLRPVEEIRERLYANALVMECGGERVCLLSLDILSMGCDWADLVRRTAAERYGLRPEAIMVHVLQNHAAPAVGHLYLTAARTRFPAEYPWLMGGDDRYHPVATERCVEAIGQAVSKLEPATLSAGRGIDGRVAFNRRFVMRDGSVRCHPPLRDPSILHAEGPTDPEVGVATITNGSGRVISALLHHTSHPCHGYPHRYVIGDWPGAWAARMREYWGEDCVPLVVNGCCGNVHHRDHTNPNPVEDHLRMAAMLTETTRRVLDTMTPVKVDGIEVRRTVLPIPIRELPEADRAAAARLLAEHPDPMWTDAARTSVDWDWVYAVTRLDLEDARKEHPTFPYEVQVLRLGDFALVGVMGEPFVEAQLEIKLASPAAYTFVAHFCNGYVGYVPTQRAFRGGGYETRTSSFSRLVPEALPRVVEAAIRLLR